MPADTTKTPSSDIRRNLSRSVYVSMMIRQLTSRYRLCFYSSVIAPDSRILSQQRFARIVAKEIFFLWTRIRNRKSVNCKIRVISLGRYFIDAFRGSDKIAIPPLQFRSTGPVLCVCKASKRFRWKPGLEIGRGNSRNWKRKTTGRTVNDPFRRNRVRDLRTRRVSQRAVPHFPSRTPTCEFL